MFIPPLDAWSSSSHEMPRKLPSGQSKSSHCHENEDEVFGFIKLTDIRNIHLRTLLDGPGRAQHRGAAGELDIGVWQARVVHHGELAVQEEAGLSGVGVEAVE